MNTQITPVTLGVRDLEDSKKLCPGLGAWADEDLPGGSFPLVEA
jgi:hypothetical protein